jgi:hypothetical protein
VEPCGGRHEAFDSFRIALKNNGAAVPLLLVDADELVTEGRSVWQHLKARDRWDKPPGAKDDQAFLMVQVMES